MNKDNVRELFKYADGAIAGTSLKFEGKSENRVDPHRVVEFMNIVKKLREEK